MITYVASLFAKPGHELAVTKLYQDLEPLMREAPGYRGRKILRARPGTMEAEVRRVIPPEEFKGHAREDGPAGVHFLMVEQWDSVADRVAFSRSVSKERNKELFPHMLPQHSHEFYEDVTPQ
jgi:quinol monooxygenase YgiN